MKALVIVSLVCFIFISVRVFGDDINDEKQSQFELEDENIQIHDIEAERKAAEEEARHEEEIKKQDHAKLVNLRAEKTRTLKKAQGEIAAFEARRSRAVKDQKAYQNESTLLQKQIQALNDKVNLKETQAKTAEDLASTGKKEVEKSRDDKADLLKRNEKAEKAIAEYTTEAQRLQAQYQKLTNENGQLSDHVKMVEENSRRRLQQRDLAKRNLASAQAQNKNLRNKIRNDTGNP